MVSPISSRGTGDGGEASSGETRAGGEERTVGESCEKENPQVKNVMLAKGGKCKDMIYVNFNFH